MNLVTPKAGVKHELLFKEPAYGFTVQGLIRYLCTVFWLCKHPFLLIK